MVRGEEMLAMGDCAINISYEDKLDKEGNVTLSAAAQLAEVAVETAKTAKVFGIDPKVASWWKASVPTAAAKSTTPRRRRTSSA